MTTTLVFTDFGDGTVIKFGNAPWNTQRNAAQGASAPSTDDNTALFNRFSSPQYRLDRVFMPFNTGAVIPANAVIDSVTFNFWNINSDPTMDPTAEFVIVQGKQVDPSILSTFDYDEIDGVDSPVEAGRDTIGIANALHSVSFSPASLGWIKRTGETSNAATEAVLIITPRSPSSFKGSAKLMAWAAKRITLNVPNKLTWITS